MSHAYSSIRRGPTPDSRCDTSQLTSAEQSKIESLSVPDTASTQQLSSDTEFVDVHYLPEDETAAVMTFWQANWTRMHELDLSQPNAVRSHLTPSQYQFLQYRSHWSRRRTGDLRTRGMPNASLRTESCANDAFWVFDAHQCEMVETNLRSVVTEGIYVPPERDVSDILPPAGPCVTTQDMATTGIVGDLKTAARFLRARGHAVALTIRKGEDVIVAKSQRQGSSGTSTTQQNSGEL